MTVKYKLVDGLDSPINLSEMNDNRVYKIFTIEPNKLYTLAKEDTCERVIKTMQNFTIKLTENKEQELINKGVKFVKKACPSCSGRVIKLEVKPIEVIVND